MEQRCPLGSSGPGVVSGKILLSRESGADDTAPLLSSPPFCADQLKYYCSANVSAPTILFVTYGWSETGGGTVYPRSVALELAYRGYGVAVFYASLDDVPSCPPYLLTESREQNLRLFGLSNRPAPFTDPDHPEREVRDPMVLQRFCQVLDKVSPDLVHFHNFHGLTFALAEETYRRQIPSCFTPHNYHLIDPDLYLLKNELEQWDGIDPFANSEAVARNPDKLAAYHQRVETARRLVNEWVTVTLAVSQRQKELLSAYGCDSSRIAVLHQVSPVADRLWPDPILLAVPHRTVSLPLRIGFIGGVLPIKGVHMLVAAAQAFSNDQLEIHVHGFAQGNYLEQLVALDRKGRATFHGPYRPENLAAIAKNLDFAVLPSVVEESAPTLVLSELHAMRLPVIAARIGGIPEFINEGVDGLLYRHDNLDELVAVLRKCVVQPRLVRQMRSNLTGPTHSFGQYMEHLEQLYRRMLHGEMISAESCSLLARHREQPGSEATKLPSIRWQGGLFVHHSLSLVNRELCLQLLGQGIKVSFQSTEPDEFDVSADPRFYILEECRARRLKQVNVTVRHHWPPNFAPVTEGRLVVIQPWEYGSIPAAWVEPINMSVDELWVPSSFVRDCYIKGGVSAEKVCVVPNGVDTECFNPRKKPRLLATNKSFRFLFVGGTIHRKGIDLLLAAYAANFSAADDVCLVIKDMGGGSIYKGQTAGETIRSFQAHPGHPELLYIEEMLDNNELASLYAACHCLAHPYRGEGFGLPIAEAMACGLPAIVTGFGAALDFCSKENAYLIPAKKVVLPAKKVAHLETVDYPWLAEPDEIALGRIMRHVFTHQEEAHRLGIAASRYIQQHFTWKAAARIAEERLCLLASPRTPSVKPYINTSQAEQSGTRPTSIESVTQRRHNESEDAMQNDTMQIICLKADKLAQRGDIDSAVQLLLNQGILTAPDSPIPYLALAELLISAERFEEALGVIPEMPTGTDITLIRALEARCYCALGDDANARLAAKEAGQCPQALVVLGTLSARQGGDMVQAESLFRQAITIDEGCGEAWVSLGMLLWGKGDKDAAWSAVKQAVAVNPLNKQAVDLFRDMTARIG